jgi:hypothetical protein
VVKLVQVTKVEEAVELLMEEIVVDMEGMVQLQI